MKHLSGDGAEVALLVVVVMMVHGGGGGYAVPKDTDVAGMKVQPLKVSGIRYFWYRVRTIS